MEILIKNINQESDSTILWLCEIVAYYKKNKIGTKESIICFAREIDISYYLYLFSSSKIDKLEITLLKNTGNCRLN